MTTQVAIPAPLGPPSSAVSAVLGWFPHHKRISAGLVVLVLALIAGIVIVSQGGTTQHKAAAVVPKVSTNPIVATYQKQLPALAAAAAKAPASVSALRDYGVALYATGDLAQAATQYEAELKIDKSDPVLLNNLGNVYRDLGSYPKALQSYQQSISLAPKSATAYMNLANLYDYTLNQKPLGITTIQAGLKALPTDTNLGVLLGIAYEQTKDTKDAVAAFQAVLKEDPTNASATAGLKRNPA